MSLPSSGSITPRSTARTSSGVGRAAAGTTRILPAASRVNSMAHGRAHRRPGAAARAAEGARRQHPLRDLPRAGPRARAAGHRADRRHASGCTPTRCAPTSTACARSGLLEVVTDAQGAVGRPQHRYSLAADAPSLGLRAPGVPGAGPDAAPPGRHRRPSRPPTPSRPGASRAPPRPPAAGAARAPRRSPRSWPRSGFDPESVVDDDGATIAFTRCPFRELAEANPDLVCGLHRGLVEGFVDARGDGEVVAFHDLADRTPCQVEIATAPPVACPSSSGPRRRPLP